MSDQSQGEGWWQASDGKWYPPPRPDVPVGGTPAEPVQPVAPTQPVAAPPPGPPTGPPPGPTFGPPTGPPGAPGPVPGAAGAPPKSGLGRGPIIAVVVAVLVIIGAVVFFATRDSGNGNKAAAVKSDRSDTSSDSTDSSSSSKSSSKSSSSNSAGVPSGFKVIENKTEGVHIAVPGNFQELNPSSLSNTASQSDFSSLNPELAPFLSSGNAFLGGSVLAATGPTDAGPAFVVVAKSPQSFDPTDPQFATELENQLKTAGATNVTTDNVSLPAGSALRVGVTLSINTAASSGTVAETLYFVTVGHTTWGIIGASVGGSAADVFDQVAKTFAVTS